MKIVVIVALLLSLVACGRDDSDTYEDMKPSLFITDITPKYGILIDNRSGEPVDLELIDCFFEELERELGYENTPANLAIILYPDLFPCPPNILGKIWCGGVFWWGNPSIIQVVHDSPHTLVFEMNRYFKWWWSSPDWDCEYAHCLGDYVDDSELRCPPITLLREGSYEQINDTVYHP